MTLQFGKDISYLGCGAGNTATGTTLSSTPIFNLTGYDGIAALVTVAVTATNNGLALLACTASGGTFGDLAGTWTTCQTTQVMSEVHRPAGGPFFKYQLRQGTSGQHGPIHVFGISPRSRAVTSAQNSTLLTYKMVNSPVSGTATSS